MKLNSLLWKLRVAAMTISGFFMSSLGFILLFPLLLGIFLFSKFVHFLIWIKLGNKYTRPGGLDVLQGVETFRSRPYINAVARYEGKVNVEGLQQKFLHLIYDEKCKNGNPRFKRLRQILEPCYGYHIFRDVEDFDIKKHILDIKMKDIFPERDWDNGGQMKSNLDDRQNGFESVGLHPVNGNKQTNNDKVLSWERIMQRLMGNYGILQMPEKIPQWQLYILDEHTNHSTVLFKVNHGFTDGIYFLRFFLEYVADRPVKAFLPYNYHQSNWIRKFFDGFWAFCLLPYGISMLSFPYENNPFHGQELSGEKMFLVSKTFPLKLLKEIKQLTKVSVNAVLFSCLSNAMATHFIKKRSKVPYVIALVPISLQNMKGPVKLKNGFGLKGIVVPTFIDKNNNNPNVRDPQSPVERLTICQTWVDKTKSDPSFLAIQVLCQFLSHILPTKYVSGLLKTQGLTTTLSNVAGPQDDDHYITGARKSEFCFWIPDRSPLGMGVSVAGYKGDVRIGLMIDKILCDSDQEGYEFLEAFLEEVYNLHNFVKHGKEKSNPNCLDEESSKLIINKDIP